MSLKAMSAVWDHYSGTGSHKLTLLALADWCNDEGESLHPSHDAVARKCGISRRQAQRIIREFESQGLLEVVANKFGGKPGATKHYRLRYDLLLAETGDASDTGDIHDTGDTGDRDGCHGRRRRVSPVTQTGVMGVTQTTIEPSKNHQRTTSREIDLPDWLDPADWKRWDAHRKAKSGKAWTAAAAELAIKKLTRLRDEGNDPVSLIDDAIEAGWSSFYPRNSRGGGMSKQRQIEERNASLVAQVKAGMAKMYPNYDDDKPRLEYENQ